MGGRFCAPDCTCGRHRGREVTPEEKERRRKRKNTYLRSWRAKRDTAEFRKKNSAYMREWNKKNPEKSRATAIRSRHGLTSEEYAEMLTDQNGVCAICGLPPQTGEYLTIDHDHSCCPRNKSCSECRRGLLCPSCNAGLGQMKDSPELLRAGAEYLKSFSRNQ